MGSFISSIVGTGSLLKTNFLIRGDIIAGAGSPKTSLIAYIKLTGQKIEVVFKTLKEYKI